MYIYIHIHIYIFVMGYHGMKLINYIQLFGMGCSCQKSRNLVLAYTSMDFMKFIA